jgi:hypothetical protein
VERPGRREAGVLYLGFLDPQRVERGQVGESPEFYILVSGASKGGEMPGRYGCRSFISWFRKPQRVER